MIIHPAGKRRDVVRAAVLHDEGRARSLDDGRLYDLARMPKGLRVYVPWDTADELARAGKGELLAWGDEPIRWRPERKGDSARRNSDAVIVKLPVDTRKEFEHGIASWCEWLDGHETNPGWSLGGTSMSLLRSTLDSSLVTTLGELPPSRWTLGGRQQCFVEPGTIVRGAVQLDLPAAYTHVIGGLRYGGAWRECADRWRQWHDAGFPCLVRAHVKLPPGLQVGPLHRRPARRPDSGVEEIAPTVPYPVKGSNTGLWTAAEIEQAEAVGARIRVTHAYVHVGGDLVFADWHDAIMEGRALPGYGGQLAKAIGNGLWGQFVIDDRKRLTVQRWNGIYKALPVQASGGHQVRAWDVGEIVCGTVRAKLYEGMRGVSSMVEPGVVIPADSGSSPVPPLICCHTDGMWVRDTGTTLPDPWRIKSEAAELHVLDQQKYRYREQGKRTFKTVFSGVPASRADEVFQRLWAAHA